LAQTEISREKIKAYEATHYRAGVGPDAFVLQIGKQSPELALHYNANGANCAVFITAFNPFGKKQDEEANKDAHARLGEVLHPMASAIIEGEGSDPSGKWRPEKSYLTFGIDADAARELGRRFKQDAVVWIGKDAVPQLLLLR
jgi:hypothetical protein